MQKRKSFILHKDSLSVLDELTDVQAGQLFKAIKFYQLGEDYELDPLLRIAFAPFKNQFARDDEKYIEVCKKRAESGARGGKAKADNSKQKLASASKCKQNLANLADSDSKSDSKSKNDSDSKRENIPYQLIADSYNQNFADQSGNSHIAKLTEARKRIIRKAWKYDTDNDNEKLRTDNLDYWDRYFSHCATIAFFQADCPRSGDHATWNPDIEFILREKTQTKVREGGYK